MYKQVSNNPFFLILLIIIGISCSKPIKDCNETQNDQFVLMPYSSKLANKHEFHIREEHFLFENACRMNNLVGEKFRLEKIDSMIYQHIKNVQWWKYEYIGLYFYKNSSCIESHKNRIRFDEEQLYRVDDGCGNDLIWKYGISIDKKNRKIEDVYVLGENNFFNFLPNEKLIYRENLKRRFMKKRVQSPEKRH